MNAPSHQPPQMARANGLDLCYEIFGDPAAEPLILIMGLGSQMIQWDDDFCRQLAARGFRVIRFDNRDIGKSSKLSGGKPLSPMELLKLRLFKIPVKAPYRLSDMAEDTVGLMDALGIQSAHLVGASDGRHDRPGDRDLVSATRSLAHLDHVDHGQSEDSPAPRARPWPS